KAQTSPTVWTSCRSSGSTSISYFSVISESSSIECRESSPMSSRNRSVEWISDRSAGRRRRMMRSRSCCTWCWDGFGMLFSSLNGGMVGEPQVAVPEIPVAGLFQGHLERGGLLEPELGARLGDVHPAPVAHHV